MRECRVYVGENIWVCVEERAGESVRRSVRGVYVGVYAYA